MSSFFDFPTTRSHRLSDDGMSDDSNVEHLSSDRSTRTPEMENLYWLGRQVLSYKLARDIVSRPPHPATAHDLDMELLRRKSTMPYSARLALISDARIQPGGLSASTTRASDSYAYCVALGRLAVSNGEQDVRDLDLLIQGEGDRDERGETLSNGSAHTSDYRPGDIGGPVPFENVNVATEAQMAHYSMALQEYGTMVGREASYSVVPSPTIPASFFARVNVNGFYYEGTARTKKQAKHIASRAACRAIGIRA